ncbi:hypothetical protein EOPP23_06235 [Endozoicomonas sp. OPT23]|uniref:hypothetical protein n=1 Tax=Endozoicomonas sp. OPT23 TaxID=2072845 RepID=UPI00129BA3E0|nr:hypothetical protein [Endozoicomonas sp. OPT23]MRI32584.1 hypothetical protein [Endozoicomonas sp. OPT23]
MKTTNIFKKTLLAGALATLAAGFVQAEEQPVERTELQPGDYKFSLPIGPFYDPDFDVALAAVPNAVYKWDENSIQSDARVNLIYGSNKNWNIYHVTRNYFANNKWFFEGRASYMNGKDMTMANFITGNGLVSLQNINYMAWGTLGYSFFDNSYLGPLVEYMHNEFDRDPISKKPGQSWMQPVNYIADTDKMSYGLSFTFNTLDDQSSATDGRFIQLKMLKTNKESEAHLARIPGGVEYSDGTEVTYNSLAVEYIEMFPLSKKTSLMWKTKGSFNGKKAGNQAAPLGRLGVGFSRESTGRSALATTFMLRHWLTDRWGVAGTFSTGRPFDVAEGKSEQVMYAAGIGLRYLLVPEQGVNVRFDITASNQDDEAILAYFNLGDIF